MFTLTRPHRQIVATLALIVVAVLPTAYVAWTAWRINRPGHVREVEAELCRQLGLRVSLESVRYPRPGLAIYHKAVLRHHERGRAGDPGAEVARAESVRVRRDGRELALIMDDLRLRAGSPRQALAQVSTLLQRAGGSEFDRVSLAARACSVDLGAGLRRYALKDLAGSLQLAGGTPSANASFKVVEEGLGPRCELAVVRDPAGSATQTELTFKTTDGQPVSARVLDPFFAAETWLGDQARVEGELRLSQAGAADWEAMFRGTLVDVDLGALIGRFGPEHRLRGLARVSFQTARWADQGGRGPGWVEIKGELQAGHGRIGSELLRGLQSRLGFRLDRRVDLHRAEDWDFQALGLAFTLDGLGEIRLEGALGAEFLPGAVVIQGQRVTPLVSAPEGVATVASLIRTLVLGDDAKPEQWIPVSRESQALQRYLPAPSARATARPAVQAN